MTAPRTDAVTVEQMLAATDMMKRILKRAVKNAVANDTSDQEFLVDFLVRKNFIYLEKKIEAIRDFLSASTNTIEKLQRENKRLREAMQIYFDRYMQDEADTENWCDACLTEQQHIDAIAVKVALTPAKGQDHG